MHIYPIITTPAIAECRDFYVRAFDARVLFQARWYVQLAVGDFEIGFLHPAAPKDLPVFRHATPSRGLCLAVEVSSVQAVYDRLIERGIATLGKPEESANGEIALSVSDPAGVILTMVERHGGAPAAEVIEL